MIESKSGSKTKSSPYEHISEPIKKKEYKEIKAEVSNKNYVRDIDLINCRPSRAGVILYTDDSRYGRLFGFGVDKQFNELTDFAGGVSYGRDGNVIGGALRELWEETIGLVRISLEDASLPNCLAIYNNESLTLFIPIEYNYQALSDEYKKLYLKDDNASKCENLAIEWYTESALKAAIRDKRNTKIYKRTLKLLRGATNFFHLIK